jgi:hypothetical protein
MNNRITSRVTMFRQRGAALIIVLAFVVLLTGLVVAYFSRAATDRQLSSASFNNTASDLLARSALVIVVSDLKQEIAIAPTVTSANILPLRSGNPSFAPATGSNTPTDPIPNLIRRSVRLDAIAAPGVGSRASAVNSETDVSTNGRWVSRPRWNSHYLVPRKNASPVDDSTPIDLFTSPDWVLMTRSGPAVEAGIGSGTTALYNSVPTNTNYVVGRYSYAVYDEGGLLDMNVAAYPYPNGGPATVSVTDVGRKGVITFADLMGVSGAPTIMSDAAANKFVLFRNYGTTGSAKKLSDSVTFTSLGTFLPYYLGGTGLPGSPQVGTTTDFGQINKVSSNATAFTRTDQSFITRQELIKFRYSALPTTSADIFQYLGTFSREQNKPTWPKVQGSTLVFPVRYYMAKLANLVANPNGTSAGPHFGLHWVSNGSYWQYYGGTGSSTNAIPAINVNSTIDFFQLLNYALHPDWNTGTADANNIATTLAVGAALIDQYDDASFVTPSGSTTTRIDYLGGTVYGMEPVDTFRPAAAPVPPTGYYSLNRPFRNVGEFGYAYRQGSIRSDQTLDFSTATSPDAGVLDFFSYNVPGVVDSNGDLVPNVPNLRTGIINLNTRQPTVLAAALTGALTNESTSATNVVQRGGTTIGAVAAGNAIVNTTESASGGSTLAALSRGDAARLASVITTSLFGGDPKTDETKETIGRALAEVGQTRTWGLLIDVVAQTGHYAPSATTLANFVVDGEKRYWLHVAIDRFDGTIVGQQLEEVLEQ